MPKRRQTIEIVAPVMGIRTDLPSDTIDPRAQATGQDFKCYYGINQKEYGTTVYATGTNSALGTPINFLYEAAYTSLSVLQVMTHTSVYKYTGAADTFVVDGQLFTGTYTDFWSGVMHNGAFFYTNGVDPIQVKNSVSATGTNMASALSPATYKAWALQSIRDHLCLYHTIEGGTEFPNRVRWTKKGMLNLGAGTTDFASGVAGAIDLQDVEGIIRVAAPLSGSIALYGDRSIHLQYWVGSDEVFRFTKTVSGIGTPSRRGVIGFEGVNFILSRYNVFAYFGGEDLRPIGDSVRKLMFSEVNPGQLDKAYLEFDDQELELLVHLPTGTSTSPDTTWVYKTREESWARLKRSYTAAGKFSRKSGLTWGEVPGRWVDQTLKWGDSAIQAEAPVRIYGDASGRVVKVDPGVFTLSYNGTTTAQTYIYETPDLTGKPSKDPIDSSVDEFVTTTQRWQKWTVQCFGVGSSAVLWSTDNGRNFTPFDDSPITLSSTGTVVELDQDVGSPQIRYRFVDTGTGFVGIEYSKVNFIPGDNY